MLELRIVPKLLPMTGSARRKSSVVNIIFFVAGLTSLTETRKLTTILVALGTLEAVVNS